MISELSRRRDNFNEQNSVPVKLADGQEWGVPVRSDAVTTELLAAIAAAGAGADDVAVITGLASTLAAHLLRSHYDLSDEDLDGLLAYRADDAETFRWMPTVVSIAAGVFGFQEASSNATS
jgi:hypothetical protein